MLQAFKRNLVKFSSKADGASSTALWELLNERLVEFGKNCKNKN